MRGPLFVGLGDAALHVYIGHNDTLCLGSLQAGGNKGVAYRRIVKRVVLLWVLGMVCQGNLLGLNPDRLYLYSNTLQAIAMGYLIASLLYLNTSVKVQIGVAVACYLPFGVAWNGYRWESLAVATILLRVILPSG